MKTLRTCRSLRSDLKRTVLILSLASVVAMDACDTANAARPPSGGPTPAQLNPAIAFVAAQTNGREDIVVAAGDLASSIVITTSLKPRKGGRLEMGSPCWSSDGQWVAFWLRDWVSSSDAKTRLYVARADGSGLRIVRDFSTRPSIYRPGFPSDGLNWSPSGNELVYASGGAALVAIDAGTGDLRLLLDAFASGDPVGQPALSPDLDLAPGYQGMLAVVGPDGSMEPGGTLYTDVYMIPMEDDAEGYVLPVNPALILNVTNAPGSSQYHPSWSPDGTEIAIFDDEDLSVIDGDSGEVRTLPGGFFTHVSADERATWTSDGQYLVYKSPTIGTGDFAIIAADGSGEPQTYTNTRSVEFAPAWNPQWDPAGPGGY